MVGITKILVNYLENPEGITHIEQIGWKITSDTRDVHQAAYQLQIADDAAFTQIRYDSKRVESEESVHNAIQNNQIAWESLHKYHLRVKITTTGGEESAWKNGFFITAMVRPEDWSAQFITIETEQDSQTSKGFYVRREIEIVKKVKSAFFASTALGLYHAFLNGQKIGEDEFAPGWTSYGHRLLYQVYDVTQQLCAGTNALGAHVGAGWYKGKMGFVGSRNHYGTRAAFACQLKVTYEDGTTAQWASAADGTWRGCYGPVEFSEIYDGEAYDARLEIPGWSRAGCSTEGWATVSTVAYDTRCLAAQGGCRVRSMDALPAKRVFTTPQGDTVLDFGQNLTGWVSFRVQGKPGDRVELNCFEVLDRDGNVYLDNLRSAKQTLTYICKDEQAVEFHPHFSFQGFQFVRVASYPGAVEAKNFTACAVHSDMTPTGSFSCSNNDINQLQHNIVWGMKGNFLDVPTDCPQRDERLGWTGDAQIFCRTASYLMDTYTFFSKWLQDLAADQTAEGGVPHVVPDILIGKSQHDRLMKDGDHSAAAWGDAAVIVPWTLYLVYGDKNVIYRQYESMRAWIDYMHTHAKDGIWNYKLQFGDWLALDAEEGSYFGATPNDLTCSAFYAYSTGLFAKMARIIGKEDDAQTYGALYEDIVKKYQEHFFTAGGRLTAQTQTAQVISLYFELVPKQYRQNVVDDLLRLLEQENGHLVTGFVGTPYICHVLSQNGHAKEAYELLLKEDLPSWLYQVKQGATTVWEHWDGRKPDGTMWSADMNSFNHYAYGAIGDWLYRVVAGIACDPAQPGYKHIVIAPHTGGGLRFAKAAYESVYGTVGVDWSQESDKVTLRVEIPCNTTATVCLPQAKSVCAADGLSFAQHEGVFCAQAGSGVYTLEYRQ